MRVPARVLNSLPPCFLTQRIEVTKHKAYTAISRKVVGKKKLQSARDKTERWSGYSLEFAYWSRRNLQLCIFARGEFVFPLRRPIDRFHCHAIKIKIEEPFIE